MRKTGLILLLLSFSLVLSSCLKKSNKENSQEAADPISNRLLINALEYDRRPFVVIVPHSSNKLLTLYLDNVSSEINAATLDIEYLAGNSLKGGRVTPDFPISLPHTQAFLLGSCSSGGKCSFDKDLISGNIKTRLDFNDGQGHILKSEYAFVDGATTTPDGKVTYTPKSKKVQNQIVINTQGLPKTLDKEPAFSPLAITSSSSEKIQADLKIKADSITSALIYTGTSYQDIPFDTEAGFITITLNRSPWKKQVDIVRDDLKGKEETVNLYLLGPIVLLK